MTTNDAVRTWAERGSLGTLSRRIISRIKGEVVTNPCLDIRMRPVKKRPLRQIHKGNRLKWAEDYTKTDFSKVLFTYEPRATLDGPVGWSKGFGG